MNEEIVKDCWNYLRTKCPKLMCYGKEPDKRGMKIVLEAYLKKFWGRAAITNVDMVVHAVCVYNAQPKGPLPNTKPAAVGPSGMDWDLFLDECCKEFSIFR